MIYKIKYLVFKIIIVIVHVYAVVYFFCELTYSVKLFMHFIVNIHPLLLCQQQVLQAHKLQNTTVFYIMYENM